MLQRILALIAKELLTVLRDPRSRFVVLGPPLLQFVVFGYAATFDVTDVRYAVLDESRTALSRELLAGLEGSPDFRLVRTVDSVTAIDEMIDRELVALVIHVAPDFATEIGAGRPGDVQVILDGRHSNVASVALGYVRDIVQRFGARVAATRGGGVAGARLQIETRAWFNPNLLSRWYIVAPLGGTIAMVVVMILTSLSVAREREFGTFDQLLVAPFTPGEILVGKAVPSILFGMLDGLLLSAGAVLWFEAPMRGSLVALFLVLLLFVTSIVGVGLLISALSTTMQQGLLGAFLFIMPSVILSGFTTPIENMPGWLQLGTQANPLRHVVAALRMIFLEGAGLGDIVPQLWPLLVTAAVTLPAAAWLFRSRTE